MSSYDPCRKAIAYHQPTLERCWLICSDQTRNLAKQLMQDYPQIIHCDAIHLIQDIYDPMQTSDCLDTIYKTLPIGWKDEDVIRDFTGMTVQVSVGMAFICASRQYPLQYTPAHLDAMLNPTGSLKPIEIVLSVPK